MKNTTIAAAAFLLLFGVKNSNTQTKSFKIETDPTSFFSNGYASILDVHSTLAIRLITYKT